MATNKLSLYQAKRDFTKTAEPSGTARVKPAEHLRFVIQKHAASRLHYDLRLETDGVFKSWAVTKGPSLDPRDRRLAVEVEDHPLDYGDFEGTIPQGEYGGGTVMLWDRGFWAPDDGGDPARGLRKGELKFTLAGEKLQGSWVLVWMRHDRERDRSNRNNWLLIKHRDGYEREDGNPVTEQDRSVASGRTMEAIAAGKGQRPKPFMLAGKAAASDAVWHSNRDGKTSKASFLRAVDPPKPERARKKRPPSKMPQFIAPQLCRRVSRPPTGTDWVHEIKLDGFRMQLRVAGGEAVMRTRKGLDWTSDFAAIADAARNLDDCIIDGEVVALDHNGAPDFAAMARARRAVIRRKGQTDRLSRRNATSIVSVMPSTGNAVMASPGDVISTGRPDRNSDSARSTAICAGSPSKLAFLRSLIIRPSRLRGQTVGRILAKWGAASLPRERSWRAAVVRRDR